MLCVSKIGRTQKRLWILASIVMMTFQELWVSISPSVSMASTSASMYLYQELVDNYNTMYGKYGKYVRLKERNINETFINVDVFATEYIPKEIDVCGYHLNYMNSMDCMSERSMSEYEMRFQTCNEDRFTENLIQKNILDENELGENLVEENNIRAHEICESAIKYDLKRNIFSKNIPIDHVLYPYDLNLHESNDKYFCFPMFLNALGIVYHDQVTSNTWLNENNMNFSIDNLLGIFNKTITHWNDERLQRDNPNAQLLNEEIKVLYRSSMSGSTWQLTSIFSKFSSLWKKNYGSGTCINWEMNHPFIISSQRDMIKYIIEKKNSIGYIGLQSLHEQNEAKSRLRVANIIHPQTHRSSIPTHLNVQKSLNDWIENYFSKRESSTVQDLILEVIQNPIISTTKGYPLSSFSFICIKTKLPTSSEEEIYHFISYLIENIGASAQNNSAAVLSKNFRDSFLLILAKLLNYQENKFDTKIFFIIIFIILLIFSFLVCSIIIVIIFLKYTKKKKSKILYENFKSYGSISDDDICTSSNDLELSKIIGEGIFYEVFLGRFQYTPCVIKRYFIVKDHDMKLLQFHREASLLRRIRHPNIIYYVTSVEKPPIYYLIMEYCNKGNLMDYLQSTNPISLNLKIQIALEISRGLYFLHSLVPSILHRDINASNIFVTENLNIKIGHFTNAVEEKELNEISNTLVGESIETIAPEVLSTCLYSKKSDVYSLCIVIWQIFTRQKPYEEINSHNLKNKIIFQKLRPSLEMDYIPQVIKGILKCGWDENPSIRPTTREIVEQLQNLRDEDFTDS